MSISPSYFETWWELSNSCRSLFQEVIHCSPFILYVLFRVLIWISPSRQPVRWVKMVYHTRWFKGQAWKWLLEPSYMAPTQWKGRLEKIIFLCILEKINWIFQDAELLLTSSTQIDPESRGQQSMVYRPYPSQRPLLFTHELRTWVFFNTLKRFFTTNKR